MGEGAEAFAKKMGVKFVDQKYFYTDERWQSLQKEKAKKSPAPLSDKDRHGTVGAVALDKAGNLASGTSTGGTTNKLFGRIGDSPIIGAGTYANNRTCAVSCTGDGEYFIRSVAAYNVSAMMEYKAMPLSKAAKAAIDNVDELGGTRRPHRDRQGRELRDAVQYFGDVSRDSGRGWEDQRGDLSLVVLPAVRLHSRRIRQVTAIHMAWHGMSTVPVPQTRNLQSQICNGKGPLFQLTPAS